MGGTGVASLESRLRPLTASLVDLVTDCRAVHGERAENDWPLAGLWDVSACGGRQTGR